MIVLLSILGCTADKEIAEDGNSCQGTEYEGSDVCDAWLFNTTGENSAVLKENGDGISVNVQSTAIVEQEGTNYLQVFASGVPNYQTEITEEILTELTARPNASTDFIAGDITVSVGDVVEFGDDIGYKSSDLCSNGEGYGYWPPGPMCPENMNKQYFFPLEATPASTGEECETGLGSTGLFVNGVSAYNWSDGASYNNQGEWQNLAVKYEFYDLDICQGHSANGDYHHHHLSRCLQDLLGDDGSGHSGIFGIMADGYPIYGPFFAAGVEATSCWKSRDYYDASTELGCGGTGERTCLLVDPYDVNQGVVAASSNGPSVNEIVTSMSGNNFVATSGFYFQDYYFDSDCASQGGQYLDEHNGHAHDDLGYHYHITNTFPYFAGPLLYGNVPSNSFASCGGAGGAPGGGPGGGPPQ